MKKALILLMLVFSVLVTSSSQNKPLEQVEKIPLVRSLDNLNNSLDSLKKVLDERY